MSKTNSEGESWWGSSAACRSETLEHVHRRGSNATAISNPHVAHVKYITNLFVHYASLKMKQEKKSLYMASITYV